MDASGDRQHSQDADKIANFLMNRYGVLLGRKALAEVLNFPTVEAFDRHVQRGLLPLRSMHLDGRRGVFVLATDVARYLALRASEETDDRKGSNIDS